MVFDATNHRIGFASSDCEYADISIPQDATQQPSEAPSAEPSSSAPSGSPSRAPTAEPTTPSPTRDPSAAPSNYPTVDPTAAPSVSPSRVEDYASPLPSAEPTRRPSARPSLRPSPRPSRELPTRTPSQAPSRCLPGLFSWRAQSYCSAVCNATSAAAGYVATGEQLWTDECSPTGQKVPRPCHEKCSAGNEVLPADSSLLCPNQAWSECSPSCRQTRHVYAEKSGRCLLSAKESKPCRFGACPVSRGL